LFESYEKICTLVKKMEGIRGRKKFQKIVYLAKESGISFNEDFEWNNFGPFSRELASEIDSAKEMNLLSESKSQGEYEYELTEKGEELIQRDEAFNPTQLENLGRLISEIKDLDSQELEKISSIKYLKNQGYKENYMKNFLKSTKDYTEDQINEGEYLLRDISIFDQ